MRRYLYKNIVLYQTWGRWSADYIDNGNRFGLHGCCTRTKRDAYRIAKQMVDYLNEKAK